jgi:hypothetical protein
MNIHTILEPIKSITAAIEHDCELIPAHELGLDPHCGFLYVGEDFVASTRHRELDYYGGFEYVDSEYTITLGIWKLYFKGDCRIDNLPCWDEEEA